jgi:single-strand DNA-binding protein
MPKYGINKAILLGNVGTEPELRYLDQGIAVCNFRLATTERAKNKEGAWFDRTDWHNIVLWRQKAELAHKYLKVGSGVYIEGRSVTRNWDGTDGQKRYKTEVEVESIRLLDAATGAPASTSPPTPQTRSDVPPPNPPAEKAKKTDQKIEKNNDDLPF